MSKVLSFEEIEQIDDAEYQTVKGWGGRDVTLGSVSAADLLEWIEESTDAEKSKRAGLRLLVKALVDGPPEGGHKPQRIPRDKHDHFINVFMQKNPKTNGQLVAAALRLNGMDAAAQRAEDAVDVLKNGSGETGTGASPTVSPSQPAE